MEHRPPDLEHGIGRWMQAEARGDEAGAERALAAAFAAVADPAIPAGFSAAVLARLPRRRRVRLETVAAGLLAASWIAVWVAPIWIAALWQGLRPERLAIRLLAPLADLDRWISVAVAVFRSLAEIARVSELVATSPGGVAAIAAAVALVAVAGRLLYGLLEERSPVHVVAR